ncbi:MAG: hypothetical protein JNK72_04615 [Myxococcales bacterium]|nr:hypothetical protein [Myxococcales bacterium]
MAQPRDPFEPTPRRQTVAFAWVLDALEDLEPTVRLMFGCHAVYLGEKIVLALRARGDDDDGVWIATTPEHHPSLAKLLPSMASIGVLSGGKGGVTGWQKLPSQGEDFEAEVERLVALVRARDPRVGKVPAKKKKPATPRSRLKGP